MCGGKQNVYLVLQQYSMTSRNIVNPVSYFVTYFLGGERAVVLYLTLSIHAWEG